MQQAEQLAVAPKHDVKHDVTEEDFSGYVKFRILESVGQPGAYRRFMHTRREQRLAWAVRMSACIHNVTSALKALATHEQELKTSPNLHTIYPIWQYIADSSLPPTDLPMTIGTCVVSGRANVLCVHIRCKGRGAQQFTVSNRFIPFFTRLWTVNKMDVLLKVYTRMRVEQFDPLGTRPLAETVALLEGKSHETEALARAFYRAYSHVFLSVKHGLTDVV